MQKNDLENLVLKIRAYKCEMQTVEVKSAQKGCPTRLFDTLSSFSNQDDGGIILFGLDETKGFDVVGVYEAQDLQHRIAEQCKQMQPVIRPLFTVCDIDGKVVVSAEIPGVDITDRPVYYKGAGRLKGSFIRVGEADEPMSDYEIYSYDAYRRRMHDDIRIAELADITQFDLSLIEKYINAVKENKPNVAKLSNDEILELMGIVKNGKPTLSGVLCFSKYPQAAFPQLCITAVVVAGTKMGETGIAGERFTANKRIEGTISQMLDEAVLFIKRNMREKTIIDADGKRNDKTEYPVKALREAVLNALMHRDYSIHTEGTPIRIIMFNDRMEIINVGGLYGKLTIDSLGKVHADTRNQTLTNILEILKIAENRYSGIPTIRLEMLEYKLPEPIFESKRGSFTVTFKNGTLNQMEQKSVKTGDAEKDLLEFCKTPKNRKEIADFIGQTQYYTIKTMIMPLVREGKLELTIPDKPKSKNQEYYTR
ncbi:MAG: ATP-binding protein [Erysipelotrichaceae bacterium]